MFSRALLVSPRKINVIGRRSVLCEADRKNILVAFCKSNFPTATECIEKQPITKRDDSQIQAAFFIFIYSKKLTFKNHFFRCDFGTKVLFYYYFLTVLTCNKSAVDFDR